MELTGKCLEDFKYKFNISNFNELDDTLKHARYIQFFDELKIVISIIDSVLPLGTTFLYRVNLMAGYEAIKTEMNWVNYRTRFECTKEAIKKANELYNSNHD